MNHDTIRFSHGYSLALNRYLKRALGQTALAAANLGRKAGALGVKPTALARIHRQVLASANAADVGNAAGNAAKADRFLAAAIAPLAAARTDSRDHTTALDLLKRKLGRRTRELAATNRLLQRGVIRRREAEATMKQRERHHATLIRESLRLQNRMRRLTHQVLTAQETQRKDISQECQNELAQTLIGINLRLTILKQEARANTTGLRAEITSTQQLIERSARSVRKAARKFRVQ